MTVKACQIRHVETLFLLQVIGIPSANEIVAREEAEMQRLEKRATELGDEGLSRLGDELERAVEIVEVRCLLI